MIDPVEELVVFRLLPWVAPVVTRLRNSRILFWLLCAVLALNMFVAMGNTYVMVAQQAWQRDPWQQQQMSLVQGLGVAAPPPLGSVAGNDEEGEEEEEELGELGDDVADDALISVLLGVESARRARWAAFAGTVAGLGPGSLLVASDMDAMSSDGNFRHSVVVITEFTRRGGARGVVVNSKLPRDEDVAARQMLRMHSDSDESASAAEEVAQAIRDESRLWLGGGGPVRDDAGAWLHLHSCTAATGATELAPGVAMGGEVLEVLRDRSCFVKLLYGAAAWVPGQLEKEIRDGAWSVHAGSAAAVFDTSEAREALWRRLRGGPT